MSFWLRYLLVLIACVAAPLLVAIYEGATGEIDAGETAGLSMALNAPRALEGTSAFQAMSLVAQAQSIAGTFTSDPAKRKLEGVSPPSNGFVWVVDGSGALVASAGSLGRQGRSVGGHPLFMDTQRGYALDGTWIEKGQLFMVGATPIVDGNTTTGAVMVGEAMNAEYVQKLAKAVGFEVTLVVDGAVVASSLALDTAKSIADATADKFEPVLGGRLAKPLASGVLPLFVDHHADGRAYASLSKAASIDATRWIASVPVTSQLSNLGEQQGRLLGILGAVFFVALLIGFTLFKDFVNPVGQVIAHLSAIQQGKGDLELPEVQVAKPYRRLVKLVNWTVQRAPATSYTESGDIKVKQRPERATHSEPAPSALTGSDFPGRKAERQPTPQPPSLDELPEPTNTAELINAFPGPSKAETPKPPKAEPKDIDSAAAEAIAALTGEKKQKRSANEIRGGSPDLKPASELRGAAPNEIRGVPPNEIRGVSPNEIRGVAPDLRGMPMSDVRGAPANQIRGLELPGAPLGRGGPTGDLPPVSLPDLGDLASGFPGMSGGFPGASPFGGAPGTLPISDDAFAGLVQGIGEMPNDLEVPGPKMGGSPMMGGSAAEGADLGFGMAGLQEEDPGGFRSEATAVGAPSRELIAQSAREVSAGAFSMNGALAPDRTAVAQVPKDLLAQSSIDDNDDLEEEAHFRETYQKFLEMRKICGETVDDLGYDKFLLKLQKNKSELQKKYNCKTVRFQVYQKNGKAALKATPIRS
ncbi:MAG: hypothetical protein HY791_15195 [Deltaproteobacteria bacterium]|nr:hypothetical protein [Deltaproteobacteria bacterium]